MAEFKGYIVFQKFETGRPVNLIEAGGPYLALYSQIKAKVERSNELFAKWEKENPPKKKALLWPKLITLNGLQKVEILLM